MPLPLCHTCGLPFTPKPRAPGVGERTAEYCTDNCYQLTHLLGKMEGLLERVMFAPETATALRARLWSAANVLNRVGKPESWKQSERQLRPLTLERRASERAVLRARERR